MGNFEMLNELRDSALVHEKKLSSYNHVSSFNFTNKTFWNQHWTNISIKARGLFIDTETADIVARSYDKFFNVGEMPSTSIEELNKNMNPPFEVYIKENGYLGIASSYNGELFAASKSTTEGSYAKKFKDILLNTLDSVECVNNFIRMCDNMNMSCIFEVIDPVDDPHIIKYNKKHVVLLDMVENTYHFNRVPYYYMRNVLHIYGLDSIFEIKHDFGCEINGISLKNVRFSKLYDSILLNDRINEIEGVVVIDSNNNMVKIKSDKYRYLKALRSIMYQLAIGKDENAIKTISKYGIKKNIINMMNQYISNTDSPNIIEFNDKFLHI